MKTYAEREIFLPTHLTILAAAQKFVAAIPDDGPEWRCHEIARAVGQMLCLPVVDGHLGAVQHSWLWLESHERFGPILDTYVPGVLPQVQLIDTFGLLPWSSKYVPGDKRTDIRHDEVKQLLAVMQGVAQ